MARDALLRVAPGELTCTGCGETAINGVCPLCGSDDDGHPNPHPPSLVPSVSYLREGEYVVVR